MQHLDEGTIHAWLDGQLPRDEAQHVEAHVAECRPCADAVAEARGLIAASSRILMALDDVPREVVPKPTVSSAEPKSEMTAAAPAVASVQSRAERRAHRRWFNGGSLAAAAAIVVAIGTVTLMRADKRSPEALAERSTVPSAVAGPSPDSPVSVVGASAPPGAPTPTSAPVALGKRAIAADSQALPPAGTPIARELANELRRVGASNSRERAEEPKQLASQRQLADAAANAAGAPAVAQKAQVQGQIAALNKPTDELKDKKQEAQQAPARLDGVAARDNRAKTDSNRADRSQAREADVAAAKVVSVGGVRGRVIDANNTGLSGAMVSVAGTTTGVPTNDRGEFTLGGLPAGSYQMTVRHIGYTVATREVVLTARQTVTTDVVLTPAATTLSDVVTTSTAGAAPVRSSRARAAAPPPAAAALQAAPTTPLQTTAAGCYQLGITPTSSPSRTGFRQMPRSVALDTAVAPSTAEGVWYRARDLSKTGALPNGTWRPAGAESIELSWTYGTRTAQINLNGPPGSMLRGTIQEIDRATATGEAGTVVTIRRPCEP